MSTPADTEFWAAREELCHIHTCALARRVSPWATLGVVLCRVIAAVPPRVVLPPIVAGRGSLNLFVGLVGAPGSTKGGSTLVAGEAVRLGNGSHAFDRHTLGTGQAIAHAYGRRVKDEIERHSESALFTIEEIDALSSTNRQIGSTLFSELRKLYMGEPLGAMYVDLQKRVEIAAHSYRAGLIAHIQPQRAGPLLDDADGGLPQRFVWLPTPYPHPDVPPAMPELPWTWNAPRDLRGIGAAWAELKVCAIAEREIDAAALARARGEGDPLDGHRLFAQEKIAAALGILAGRVEISDEDWQLSAEIMAVSDFTRANVQRVLAERKRSANHDRAEGEAARAVVVEDALDAHAVERVSKGLLAKIPRAPEWISYSRLRRQVHHRSRDYFDEAIDALSKARKVIPDDSGRGMRFQRPM